MSFKAQIEFALHLHAFKNIQIDRKGYAAVRIQIIDESSPNTNYALAYNCIPFHKVALSNVITAPEVDDYGCNSSTVKIEYKNQRYILNDIIQFRLLVESLPRLQVQKIYMRLTLLFSSSQSYSRQMNPNIHGMEKQILKLQNIQFGVFHFYEAQFKQFYASSVTFTLFAMITDFKLFPYSMRKEVITQDEQQKKKQKQRQKISTLQQLLTWSSKYLKNCKEPIKYFYNNYVKALRYNSNLLKNRAYQNYKIKKQIKLKLPKFYKQTQNVTFKEYLQYFQSFDTSSVTLKILQQEIYILHQQNFFFSNQIAEAMSKGFINYQLLENEYLKFLDDENKKKVISQIEYGNIYVNQSHANENITIANKIRKQYKQSQIYPIRQNRQKVDEYIFHQICFPKQYEGKLQFQQLDKIKKQLPYNYDQRKMIIFLCHGFQASSNDMYIIQRGIKQALPLSEIILSTANQNDTDIDIEEMGKNLAEEVQKQIRTNEDFNAEQLIINFVGHSMGGIIARASLKYLKKYENQFGFYCSLGTPHLGYQNGTDNIIKAGMWLMRKFMKHHKSLDQLTMSDGLGQKNTFLYRLSYEGNLKKFNKIILISSAEDNYVPWHSARICRYNQKYSNNVENQMVQMIIGNNTVHRIDINFACQKNDIDGIIGRKAHINFLLNLSIFKLINAVLINLFDLRKL